MTLQSWAVRVPRAGIDWSDTLWGASGRCSWPGIEVLIAPSRDPKARRANTIDQLQYWADSAEIVEGDTLLLVTTQIYTLFQHFTALRILGLRYGCIVYTSGVSNNNALLPLNGLSARAYLQELWSVLHSAKYLLEAVHNIQNNGK